MVKMWRETKRVGRRDHVVNRPKRWPKVLWVTVLLILAFSFFTFNTLVSRYEVVAFGDTYDFIVFDKFKGKAVLYEMFEDKGVRTYEPREIGDDPYLHLKRTDNLM